MIKKEFLARIFLFSDLRLYPQQLKHEITKFLRSIYCQNSAVKMLLLQATGQFSEKKVSTGISCNFSGIISMSFYTCIVMPRYFSSKTTIQNRPRSSGESG
jgi:hypothetical protein